MIAQSAVGALFTGALLCAARAGRRGKVSTARRAARGAVGARRP